MKVSRPVGKSMIESDWPSVDRDFVEVMYCVDVPEWSPIVTFETTVRSWAASGSAKAARRRATVRRPTRIIGQTSRFRTIPRVSPRRWRLLADRLTKVELSRVDVPQVGNLSRRPSDPHAICLRGIAEAEKKSFRA